MSRPFTIRLARLIGRQEFDNAIDYLRAGLKGNKSDAASLLMIAECHHWAGRDDQAVIAYREALGLDPVSFDAHSELAQLLASKGEHEDAALHARKGIECYPEPLPEAPRFVIWAFNALGRIVPRLRVEPPNLAIRTVEATRAKWLDWANQYLSWYDATYGQSYRPPEH